MTNAELLADLEDRIALAEWWDNYILASFLEDIRTKLLAALAALS